MKISEYDELFTPDNADFLVVVHAGTTYKCRIDVIQTSIGGGGGGGLLDPAANGFVVRNAENITVARSLVPPAAGFTITNPDGVAANPVFALANDLAALEGLTGAGYPKRTGVDAWALQAGIPAADIAAAQPLTAIDDTNVTIDLGGAPATALITPVSITLGWTGQLSVPRGGTGAATLANNGILYGGGIGPIQALAVNASAVNKFLTQSNGNAAAWATITAADLPGGFSGFANPTALIGMIAQGGSATTAMRSDAAPAINPNIAPTWTALHTFSAGISMAGTKITNLQQGTATTDALAAGRTITEGAGLAGNTYDLTANRTLALGLPSTLTVSTTNAASGTTHTHAIASSSNPGAAASILATDASGYLTTVRLTATDRIFVNAATANLLLKDTSTGWQSASSLVITPLNNNAVRSTNFTAGLLGWSINAAGDAEFNNILARGELRASVFKVNEIAATAGTFGVFYSAANAYADFTTAGSVGGAFSFQAKNSDTAAALFAVGDRIRIKAYIGGGVIIADAWAEITSAVNSSTFTTYGAILRSGTTSATVRAGTAILDYGPAAGAGFITLSADGTVGASPNLTMATHAGSPWATVTTVARLGNLNGSFGYSSAVYGLGVGQYGVASDSWITIANSGTAATSGVRLGQNTTTYIHLKTDGSGYLANSSIAWDTGGNLSVTGNATIAGWSITPNYMSCDSTHVMIASNADFIVSPAAWFGRSPSGRYGWQLIDSFSNEIRAFILDGSAYPYIAIIGAGVARVVIGGLNYVSAPGGASASMGLKIGDGAGALLAEFSSVRNTIAGWTITTSRIASSHVFIDDAGEFISMGATPPTSYGSNVGFFVEGGNGGRLSLYKDANNFLQWDSTKLLIKAANFTLDAAGNITATSATVSGAITATSGSITGVLTMSGSGAAIAIGVTPPSSSSSGTGLWIDRTGLYSINASSQRASITATGFNIANDGTSAFGFGFGGSGSGALLAQASGATLISRPAGSTTTGALILEAANSNLTQDLTLVLVAPYAGLGQASYAYFDDPSPTAGGFNFKGLAIGANVSGSGPLAMLDVRGKTASANFTGTSLDCLYLKSASASNVYTTIGFDNGSGAPIAKIAMRNSASGSFLYFGTSNSYGSGVTNSAVVIDPSGFVGIGITNPSYALEVRGLATGTSRITLAPTSGTDYVLFQALNNGGTFTIGLDSSAGAVTGGSAYEAMIYNGANSPLSFWTNGVRRMTITTTGPTLGGAGTGFFYYAYYNNASSLAGMTATSGGTLQFWTGAGSVASRLEIAPGGNLRFTLYGAGTLSTDASGNVSSSSDERLKFVEGEFTRGLAALRATGRPVIYRWRPGFYTDDTSTPYVGWTTQRTAPGIPEAVMPGNPYQSLWDRAIHATMHNAILELDTRDDALQAQISSLQIEVEQLTARVAALEAPGRAN